MWECSYCSFTCGRKWNMQVHEKRKHLKQDVDPQQDVHSMEQLAQDYQNLKQNYDKRVHENRILVNDGQQRLPIEYYKNIKNQLDQAKDSNIHSMEQLAQDYQNLKQNYDKIVHENRILVNDGQQRLPIEYYQNIKNQLDQAKNSNIQWSEAYKKLHESGLELEGNLSEEEALNHNLRTQLQTVTEVNCR